MREIASTAVPICRQLRLRHVERGAWVIRKLLIRREPLVLGAELGLIERVLGVVDDGFDGWQHCYQRSPTTSGGGLPASAASQTSRSHDAGLSGSSRKCTWAKRNACGWGGFSNS